MLDSRKKAKPERARRPAPREPRGGPAAVLTLVKALDVLEAAAVGRGMTVAEIADKVGLNRTTTHRIVQTLRQLNYLQPAPGGRGFEIGLKLLPLAARNLDGNRVRVAALPHLNALAQLAGERVNLGVLFDGALLYLAGVEKPSLPNVYSRFGRLAPIHCCSLGKAIIAYYPPDELQAMLGVRPLVRQTPSTIVEPAALLRDLDETRRRGYAIDDQEHVEHLWCIAAPVFDGDSRPAAAVGISASDRERVLGMAEQVKQTAEVISHMLTPRGPV